MIEMIKDDDGLYAPRECCTFTNPLTSGGRSEIDDIDLPCGADCGNECRECVIQRIMNEYANLTGQIAMNDRTKVLIANLVEIIRQNRQDMYDKAFADYLIANTGITSEELVECGIYGEEALNND